MRLALVFLTLLMLPRGADAQGTIARNDAAISVGWAGSDHRTGTYDQWGGVLFLGASGGHYWTDHLKTEIEAAWTSEARGETYEDLTIGGFTTHARGHHRARDIRLAIGQSFQFGLNAWVHPYLGAGADIVWRTTTVNRPEQDGFVYGGAPTRPPTIVRIPSLNTRASDVLAIPYVKGGLKMYASERAFFLTELKLGFAPDLDHAVWKVGLGFDF